MTPTKKAWNEWIKEHTADFVKIESLIQQGHDRDCAIGTIWGFAHCICERGKHGKQHRSVGRGAEERT